MATICVVAFCVVLWIWFHRSLKYDIVEIQLPEGYTVGNGSYLVLKINDIGVVTGFMTSSIDSTCHVFKWEHDHGLSDLDNLGLGSFNFDICDMNNNGQILGSYFGKEILPEEIRKITRRETMRHLFLYDPNQGVIQIESLNGWYNPHPIAMNEKGDFTGYYETVTPEGKLEQRIFFWNHTTGMQDPNMVGYPNDINESGHTVGVHQKEAFFWSPEAGPVNLGHLQNGPVYYCLINDLDEVVGIIGGPPSMTSKFFRWNPRKGFKLVRNICDKKSYVVTMNKQGQLCYTTGDQHTLFGIQLQKRNENIVVNPGWGTTVLRTMFNSDDTDFSPLDMNNNGWIVGIVHDKVGQRIFVLIPKNNPKPR